MNHLKVQIDALTEKALQNYLIQHNSRYSSQSEKQVTELLLKALYIRGGKLAAQESEIQVLGMARVIKFLRFLSGEEGANSEDTDLLPNNHPLKAVGQPDELAKFLEVDANFDTPIGSYQEYQESLNSLKTYEELLNFCCWRGLVLGILQGEDFQFLQKNNFQLTHEQLNRVLGRFRQWNLNISVPKKIFEHEQANQNQ